MIAEINFSDIGKRFLLRFGSRYVDFWKSRNGKIFDYNIDTIKIKNVAMFASAKVIKKDSLSSTYQLIDLANIEPETGFPINLHENITDVIGSDKIYLSDADLAFSKLNSHIGYVFLLSDISDNEFEIIGSTEFYPLIVNKHKIKPKLLKYFLLHNSFREKAVFLRSGKSQSHPRIQRDDFFNLEIPSIELIKQKEIIDKIGKLENHLYKEKGNVESLQIIIDEIFSKYSLKTKSLQTYRVENLVTDLNYIANNKALRIGAEYNDFWFNHKGFLFEGTADKYDLLPLKRIIKLSNKNTLKKGFLNEPRILIDFEQVESPNGKIIDFENIVIELGSDRIEFGECGFLTNKLRPYLGYTILNIPEKQLIGTTEFIPFEIRDKNIVMSEYIRYLLLSKEYLEKSKFLMSGKEHPRITSTDILNIKVPIPTYETQEQIVKEIQEREVQSEKAREKVKTLRQQIDDLISEELLKLSS